MAIFSSPPAGPLAAGLERDFCRCRLEVLHLFENFTLTEKWNTMIEQRKEIEVCDHSRTVCAARTCSPRHLMSQIKRQLRVEKC